MRAVSKVPDQLKSFLVCIVYTPMFSVHTFINRSTNQCPAPQSSLITFLSLSIFMRFDLSMMVKLSLQTQIFSCIQIGRCEGSCCNFHLLMVNTFVLPVHCLWLPLPPFYPNRLLHQLHHLVIWNTRNSVMLYGTSFLLTAS